MKLSDRWFSSSSHISDGWEYDDYFYMMSFVIIMMMMVDIVDMADGGDLSFCQFQGFRFWFQH